MLKGRKVNIEDMKQFSIKLLKHFGANDEQAETVSDGLCQTSLKGIDSHGIKLLPHYLEAIQAGRINKNPNFEFEFSFPTAGRLNADHTYGHHAGVVAVKEAIKRAKEFGMCSIGVYNSSHFGAAGYFAEIAAKQDMGCMSFTHADSLMKSHGGERAYFGTNPISFCVPIEGEEPMYLDLATTMSTWNRLKNYKAQGLDLEEGWAFTDKGEPTKDPSLAACLAPMGSYKGFALGSMVEILCSVFTGMPFGRAITSMYKEPIENHRYLGQFYIVFNLEAFRPLVDFKSQMKQLATELRNEPATDNNHPVQLPGDPQKLSVKENLKSGLLVPEEAWLQMVEFAQNANIAVPTEVQA